MELEHLSLRTTQCIVTGQPALVWTGHVLAQMPGDGGFQQVPIAAGFANEQICSMAIFPASGCCGPWRPHMGLRLLRDGKPCLDSDHYRVLVSRAIGAMMHVRPPLPEPGQDVHPLTGALAERVCWLFCTGITEASRLCREFGFDPAYERR